MRRSGLLVVTEGEEEPGYAEESENIGDPEAERSTQILESRLQKCLSERLCYLDCSSLHLNELPASALSVYHIRWLYLKDNSLTQLPHDIFQALPLLEYLDLRDNELAELPSAFLAAHDHLSTILLENNRLTALPLELGLLSPLTGLQLTGNPLKCPPPGIFGLAAIKTYLADRFTDGIGTEEDDQVSDLNMSANNSALRRSRDDYDQNLQALRSQTPPRRIQSGRARPPPAPPAPTRFRKGPNIVPGVGVGVGDDTLTSEAVVEQKLRVDAKREKLRNAKNKTEKILQGRRDQEARKAWRDDSRKKQRDKDSLRRGGRLDVPDVQKDAPFGVSAKDLKLLSDAERRAPLKADERPAPLSPTMLRNLELIRLQRDKQLEGQIHEHMEHIVERKKLPSKSATEELALAKQELDIASKLQTEISRRRKEMEYRLALITTKTS